MEKINVAKLLKDCPQNMELDCTMFNKVTLFTVDDREGVVFPITVFREDGNPIVLTKYGQYIDADFAKCVIFPKGKTTWEGFVPPIQFRDGDIIFTHANCLKVGVGNTWISIFKERRNGGVATYVDYAEDGGDYYSDLDGDKALLCMESDILRQRFATEEEKEKLFQVIKDNGYKWNAETKILEKLIKPIFKVGDKVRHKNNHNVVFTITDIGDNTYSCGAAKAFWFDDQDDYEVIHEPKFKVGDRVRKKGDETATFTISDIGDLYYYCGEYIICNISYQDNYELVPNRFDISTLKPFDNCKYSLDGGITWKYAQYWFIQEKYNTNDISIELWQG